MYCPKCRVQNPDNAKSCYGCGSQLKTEGATMPEKAFICYAGFWRRFADATIDSIISLIEEILIGVVIGCRERIFLKRYRSRYI